ncbi:MAG: DUF1592 domain-containing protein [Verrucomicrobiae bacterium]|nr:DUF1592 domain-containing protein [Verrucomicrobiae bacterium]
MGFPSLFPARILSVRSLMAAALACLAVGHALSEEAAVPDWKPVRPVLEKYCFNCHGGEKTKGDVDLKALADNPEVAANYDFWENVMWELEDEEMPPEDDPQLTDAEKAVVMKWLGGALVAAANANSGDPGSVTIRRLTNVEYDHTIRDLTGVDYGYSKRFQPDGGGGEGFSNVGDVLFVNPQQLDSYLGAARVLTEHASILPGRGIQFRKERVGLRSPIQFKSEAEQALYIWYQKMAEPHLPQDDEDRREDEYMLAAWKFRFKDQTGATSLDQLAKEAKLAPAFLNNWWALLNSEKPNSRFLDLIRVPWRNLPGPAADKPKEVPAEVTQRILNIEAKHLSWNKRSGDGWVMTQRRQQDTDGLRSRTIAIPIPEGQPVHLVASDFGDGNRGDLILFEAIEIERGGKRVNYVDWLKQQIDAKRKQIAELEKKPEAERKGLDALKQFNQQGEAMLARFGKHPQEGRQIGPKQLAVRPPGLIRLPFDGKAARVRVSAKMDLDYPEADFGSHQWTIAGANPPDPKQIIPGALVIYKRQTEIARQIMGDFSQMKTAFPDEYNRLLEEVSRNYLRGGKGNGVYYLSDDQLRATLNDQQRRVHEQMLRDWALLRNPKTPANVQKEIDDAIVGHLHGFAYRAWRRPLSDGEKELLAGIYHEARSREMDSESAARETLMRVLIAPDFLFKMEKDQEPGIHPVTPWELATRLSYFLWSSTPDWALMKAAGDGTLSKPEGLRAQVIRMLKDPKAGALSEEFAGQWLEFHGFSEHNSVDPKQFPEFTAELRADMHRESQLFFENLIREDRPVREILMADYTFLNERLAKHYGIPGVTGGEFRKVPVAKYQRGGVLGMGSVLTKTSFPRRTSPVVRGNWLLVSVLGQPTPPPPSEVPELEAITDAKTLREKLMRHREEKACAACHAKIDPLGFALEGFDAIGRLRDKDDFGQPIDETGTFADGTTFEGVNGLREYLGKHDGDIYTLFARKLIGYATGRSVLATDRQLIDSIRDQLQKGEGRFSEAILAVVESRQFQNRHNEVVAE